LTTPLIVAIDGPSGAGKSTAARGLARRLGIPYLDTGAMYRAVGLAARDRGITLPIENPSVVVDLADSLALDVELSSEGTRVFLGGRDVSAAIREPEISLYASAVSAIPGVRRRLVAEQQRLGRERGGVLEGRDIGTKVFPETPHKFFLTAPAAVRAVRRARELADRGTPQPLDEVLADIERRDRDDSARADSPLTLDERYVVIDSGGKSSEAVLDEMERIVRAAPDGQIRASPGARGGSGG
jgi:cytidylate kinase